MRMPKRIATVGGIFISISGIINTALGIQVGALYYEIYPGGKMGHVGIISGIIAVLIGFFIVFGVVPLYNRDNKKLVLLAGILTMVLGHAGAVAGALYVGTMGMILCYVGGIWLLVAIARRKKI